MTRIWTDEIDFQAGVLHKLGDGVITIMRRLKACYELEEGLQSGLGAGCNMHCMEIARSGAARNVHVSKQKQEGMLSC